MTREKVAEILHYCKTKGITRKDRLKELGIAPWKFYEYKARYAAYVFVMLTITKRSPKRIGTPYSLFIVQI